MGIQGLLPLLKSIMVPIHIRDLEGRCVAVDTYSWLHKGALSCSRELCKGLPTSRHIDYCIHRVNLLRHYGIKPILVFDGGLLPMKSEQENKRARSRKENLARAIEHESNGNSAAAYECYQKAVDISPSIAHDLIQVLKQEKICYVVAPYEADAQMTFLAISKQVDAVITEDSDLIAFGCPRIIFKMDKFGQGVVFRSSMLQQNKDLSLSGFTKQMLLEMCILSGCDYLQSLPGMGLKRAHALISKFTSYNKVIKHLKYSTVFVPPLYEELFKKAVMTFQHQRVYDPITEDIVYLSDLSDNLSDDLDFLGPLIPQDIAKGIAEGDLDPFTKLPFQNESAVSSLVLDRTQQLKSFKTDSINKKLDLPVQKNVLTKYFCFASLEAKRNFRAPRISSNHSSPRESTSPSPEEPIACKTNCSPTFTDHYENSDHVRPSDDLGQEDYSAADVSQPSESSDHYIVSQAKIPERISLKQSAHSIHKPCIALHKEYERQTVPVAAEGKSRIENRKVIVRSSYFTQKMGDKNEQENNQEKLTIKDDSAVRSIYSNNALAKRKVSPNENIQMENVKPRHKSTDTTLPNKGDSSLDETIMDTKTEEGKFGSNISHLSHYAGIAERSIENFVSVISAFKYSSTGSRASGLRAPLKDVQNTRTNRSSAGVDFSQFVYVPNKSRTVVSSRKRLN